MGGAARVAPRIAAADSPVAHGVSTHCMVADFHPFRLSLGEAANPRNTSMA